jgi:hypothetical protein
MPINRLLKTIGAIALICVIAAPARAQAFRVGRLLCASTPRVGRVLGSTQSLRCVFHARNSPQQYVYVGRITRVGLDIGATSGGVLSWAVFARNSRIGPSTLRGSYVGASGNVALGPGLGVNALIGGSRRTIGLQPLSVERTIGFNLAAGVTRLTLDSRGTR